MQLDMSKFYAVYQNLRDENEAMQSLPSRENENGVERVDTPL